MSSVSEHYKVLANSNLYSLADRVNELIVKGWVPQGGIAWNERNQTYMQALYMAPGNRPVGTP